MHVKKGDMVSVIAGDDRGKSGEVLRVLPESQRVIVQGVNRVYRHLRPSRQHPKGGRIQKEMPIHISNVLPIDPKTNQPTRVGYTVNSDGAKDRVTRKSGQSLGAVKKSSK
ncbi:MAG: 50S ribosomal protein L24 [Planctomycetaceae bacterium]|nr:50S ribosomal protein L24 [Planctomycetaceae bacterium]